MQRRAPSLVRGRTTIRCRSFGTECRGSIRIGCVPVSSRLAVWVRVGTVVCMSERLMADTSRVLVCGDVHGDAAWMAALVSAAARLDARIVVLGDFGYWVHRRDGVEFLDETDALVAGYGLEPMVFIDGNHEYHSTHPAKPKHRRLGLSELPVPADGFVRVRDHVWYASRGARWVWSGVQFGALGGAASTDKEFRKRYKDWWPEETVMSSDVHRLGSGPLDVLLTHDAPGDHEVPNPYKVERSSDRSSLLNRDRLSVAVDATRPRLVLHGHWHQRYSVDLVHADGSQWRVEGFGANVSPDGESAGLFSEGAGLLLLPDLEVVPLPLNVSAELWPENP